VRALAELGRDTEYADTLAHYRAISRDMPDEGMRTFPAVMEALVDLQQGRPEAAKAVIESLELDIDENAGQLGSADLCAAMGLGLLQHGKVDAAIETLARGYADATDDGPVMSIGCRLALAYAAAQRPADAAPVLANLEHRAGGTFSDRMLARWADAFVRTQQGASDAREPVDAAYDLAIATDAPLEHAIAALARAKVLGALGADDAGAAADEAERRLAHLGLPCDGWVRVFDLALADVSVPT
jgi:tetratricopeptide (TPR) repeat protein